jgi:hypothetical protein
MYKVLAAISKYDGSGEWFMRVGSGFENRYGTLNIYLDALPLGQKVKLQIRELDARDLAQRDAFRANAAAPPASPGASTTAPPLDSPMASSANESVPF